MIIFEKFGNIYFATDGKMVLRYGSSLKFLSIEIDDIKSSDDVPEDIKRKFIDAFSDPLTEIEWLKWKSRNGL
jgi:hypothetical protein